MYSSLAGQEVTFSNVDTILGRLRRLAKLQPDKAQECETEAWLIANAMAARSLPQGWVPPAVQPPADTPAAPAPTRFNCLYRSLTGRQPPAMPHHTKIKLPFGDQFLFLTPEGLLTQGLTPSRSVGLPRAKVKEALDSGKALLEAATEGRPKADRQGARAVATLADLKKLTL